MALPAQRDLTLMFLGSMLVRQMLAASLSRSVVDVADDILSGLSCR